MKNKCKKCKTVNLHPGLYCEFCGKKTGIRPKKFAYFNTLSHDKIGHTESSFPTGKETTRAFIYRKKKAPIILSILLILCLLTGAIYGSFRLGLFSRFTPKQVDREYRSYYHIADGRAIESRVLNASAAISALNEIKATFGMSNPEVQLVPGTVVTIDGDTYYRLQEVYEGIEVYGRSIVVEVDDSGAVHAISGNFCPLSNLPLSPSMDTEKALERMQSVAASDLHYTTDSLIILDGGLKFYAPNPESAQLVYAFDLSGVSDDGSYQCHLALLDANNGNVVYSTSTQDFFTLETTGITGEPRTVEVEGTDTDYQFVDTLRNIQVSAPHSNDLALLSVLNSSGDLSLGIDALYHSEQTYDYYNNILGRKSYDGEGGSLSLITNIPETVHTFDTASAFSGNIAFYPTSSNRWNSAYALDTVAHEYTHLVLDSIIGPATTPAAETVEESICDVMGNLIEHHFINTDTTWELGEATGTSKYAMSNPSTSGLPELVSRYDETLTPHQNASILAYSAYLMYTGTSSHGLTPEETAITDQDVLSKLWYRAAILLPADAEFSSCAASLIASSYDLYRHGELTATQLSGVRYALEVVGATPAYPTYTVGPSPSLVIYDAVNEPYYDVQVTATDLETWKDIEIGTYSSAHSLLNLDVGSYLITINSQTGVEPSYTFQLNIVEEGDPTLLFYTWYNATDYTNVIMGDSFTVSGKVVGENWTDENGENRLAWVLALDAPVSIRLLTENGAPDSLYQDQVAVALLSDTLDFAEYSGDHVTLTGALTKKYTDMQRRDLCLEHATIAFSEATLPSEENPTDSAESPEE